MHGLMIFILFPGLTTQFLECKAAVVVNANIRLEAAGRPHTMTKNEKSVGMSFSVLKPTADLSWGY